MSKTPVLVAHRGDMTNYPENTITALKAAVDCGLKYVEFDIQLDRNLTPYVVHDFNQSLSYPNQTPTLKDVVSYLNQTKVTAFAEIKSESSDHFGLGKTVDAIMAELKNASFNFVVISFSEEIIRYVQEQYKAAIGWVIIDYSEVTRSKCSDLKLEYIFCNKKRLPPQGPLWPGNWQWVIYDIMQPKEALALTSRGVDMIETGDVVNMSKHFKQS